MVLNYLFDTITVWKKRKFSDSGKVQFWNLLHLYIGLDGRIYVPDTDNSYIQVFHCDDTFFCTLTIIITHGSWPFS